MALAPPPQRWPLNTQPGRHARRFIVVFCQMLTLAGLLVWFTASTAGLAQPSASFIPAKTPITLVKLHADWCASCKQVDRDLAELRKHCRRQGKLTLLKLDVSDDARLSHAYRRAERLGIVGWFQQHKGTVPVVGVFQGSPLRLSAQFTGEVPLEHYRQALGAACAPASTPGSSS